MYRPAPFFSEKCCIKVVVSCGPMHFSGSRRCPPPAVTARCQPERPSPVDIHRSQMMAPTQTLVHVNNIIDEFFQKFGRYVATGRRDCLDHVVVFGEQHLRHLLNSYQKYYNEARTHSSLHKDAPIPRTVQTVGRTLAVPILGGLHRTTNIYECEFPTGTTAGRRAKTIVCQHWRPTGI
jgi:hypothetical protein